MVANNLFFVFRVNLSEKYKQILTPTYRPVALMDHIQNNNKPTAIYVKGYKVTIVRCLKKKRLVAGRTCTADSPLAGESNS